MRPGPRHAAPRPGHPRHVHDPRRARADQPAPADRPWRRRPVTAVLLVLALLGALTLSAKAIGPSAPEPTSAPALLGAGARAGADAASARQAATSRLETAIGRKLNIAHTFVPWGATASARPRPPIRPPAAPRCSRSAGPPPPAPSPPAATTATSPRWPGRWRRWAGRCCCATAGAWTAPARRSPARGPPTWPPGGTCTTCSPPRACAGSGCGHPTPTPSPGPAAGSTGSGRATPTSTGSAPMVSTGTAATAARPGGTSAPSSRPSTPGGRPGPSR